MLWAHAMRALGGEYADMAGLHPAVVEVIEEETFGVATGPFEELEDEAGDVVPETNTIQPAPAASEGTSEPSGPSSA